ncbi:saccharopine dehydrogenase [Cellvibrio zantedeschiae]|uniref:Saccharopine dehydrogenase n=1 Tax=Cellvibrio zantedeschiae TaxID=1237077 RepID=A0ABQ3BDF4_9GAMM|nr:saccharopine dehydrogenase NADP-binding domain-containing protein [Cellvibrio zantedeschiae]GGY85243.1 saccharopine dehydrogenase [Cellvibrio zantedeschiae]
MAKTILVLGGYGNFGKRISESLAKHADVCLLVAGRNLEKANDLCKKLRAENYAADLKPVALDIFSENFAQELKNLSPFLVIHTSGPFQGQDYRVPQACIDAGAHYIDLADDRRFVCDITKLDVQARSKNLLVVSGASSVPGLSSVVIDEITPQFSRMDEIDIAIAPGNRAERGEATVKAILSYTGHPIKIFENGQWINKYGWMSARRLDFGKVVGKRWLANVDVPDLELFPARYPSVKRVNFQAGLELSFLHWGMVGMAWLAKYKLVRNWSPVVKPIVAASNWFIGLGTDIGGMRVKIVGIDHQQKPLELVWQLTATHGVGPYIPTLSAIILAEQLISGENKDSGAKPCLGLYKLEDFKTHAERWGIYYQLFNKGEEQPLG